jgi:thiosulfate/3-mercaptopyruvate sulfurtransferase
MPKYIFSIAIFILLSTFAFAQAPVLFDGTSPIPFSFQAAQSDDAIPAAQLITPEALAKSLQSAHKPLLLAVGPHSLYAQAHIPGSEYMGAGSSDAGQQKLRERVKSLPKNSAIVIYCGCCPWGHCPNMRPAFQELKALGFTNVKALYIADNFGTDWVDKGYPVAKGE